MASVFLTLLPMSPYCKAFERRNGFALILSKTPDAQLAKHMKLFSVHLYSFDNAEVYADGKAETVMGQAIKVNLPLCRHACCLRMIIREETVITKLQVLHHGLKAYAAFQYKGYLCHE